jgi:vancomycin permeability regulator SanA
MTPRVSLVRATAPLAGAALVVATPWLAARLETRSLTLPAGAPVDNADAAVVLGARVHPDGRPSGFLRERVATGVALYQAGSVQRIIMSGAAADSSGFCEPAVMRAVAERMGVPTEHIVEDPLGVDTYSSVIRARDVYGATSVIMVSQEFHLPRAVWICRRLGLAAQGVYPPPRPTKHTLYGHAREVPAMVKATLDVRRGRDPLTEHS